MTLRHLVGAIALLVLASCDRTQTIYFEAQGNAEQAAAAAAAALAWNEACGELVVVPGKGGVPVRFIEDVETDPRVGGDNADRAAAGLRRGEWDGWQNIEAGGVVNIYLQAIAPSDDIVEIIAHEMGHALGLSHTQDGTSLMYPIGRRAQRASRPTELDLRRLREVGHFCPGARR